jgi:hypothetical protein
MPALSFLLKVHSTRTKKRGFRKDLCNSTQKPEFPAKCFQFQWGIFCNSKYMPRKSLLLREKKCSRILPSKKKLWNYFNNWLFCKKKTIAGEEQHTGDKMYQQRSIANVFETNKIYINKICQKRMMKRSPFF